MKGNSLTKKQFNEAKTVFAEFGTKYLINWTKKELKHYRTQPVVIPHGNHGFFIGSYKVTGITKECWAVEQLDYRHIHDFISKQSAILFCLLKVTNRQQMANELLLIDNKLGNLDNDIAQYQHTLQTSKDKLKLGVVLNRYIDAKLQRRAYLNILKKTLNSAKYLNFGNKPL